MLTADENFISHLIMSDEAHFHMNECVNKQNYRFWSNKNPLNNTRTAGSRSQSHSLVRSNKRKDHWSVFL